MENINISKKTKIVVSLVFVGAIVVTSILTTTASVVIHSTSEKALSLSKENERLVEQIQNKTSLTKLSEQISNAGFVKAQSVYVSGMSEPLALR